MRRVLLLLALLALGALIVLFVTRPRATLPELVHAPPAPEAAPSTLDDTRAAAPTREPQAGSAAESAAAVQEVRIHGRVLFEDTRTPVAGARVLILYRESSQPGSDQKPGSAQTGPDGSYSVSVPDGALLCEANVLAREPLPREHLIGEFCADAYQPTTVDLQLRPVKGDTEVNLTVGAGRVLQGLVLERGSERPIAGAEVVFHNGVDKYFAATSEADGRFTVRGIEFFEHGPWGGRMATIAASHPEYVRAERAMPAPDDQGRWPEITLLLDPGQVVEGIVIDSQGKPVPSLELCLRPLHGSPETGLFEYEGEWRTKSAATGIFTFPRIPAFDRSWLVTDRLTIDEKHWHGASRTLLHGKDPNLRSVELRLPLEVAVDVEVRYPDGKLAGPQERLLLREDEDGKLRAAREESRFVCIAGRASRIVAWGKPRAGDAKDMLYRGETVLTVGADGADPHAEIRLAALPIQMRERVPGERSMGFGAGMWTNSCVTLRFVDRASGLPLSQDTLIGIEQQGSRITSQIGADATLRIYYEPGWTSMKLSIEGYQAYTIELEVKDNEPQTMTLPFDRLP